MAGTDTLLVEIFTEELPPKALARLGEAFAHGVADWLGRAHLRARVDTQAVKFFATPRRLAVLIRDVLPKAEDQRKPVRLMPAKIAYDSEGKPTVALLKKLEKEGLSADTPLQRLEDEPDYLIVDRMIPGITLDEGLSGALKEVIKKLPIPKVMRYQAENGDDVEFVRPAHGLVALYGAKILSVNVLGLTAGRVTHGHRFQGAADIILAHADEYETKLATKGHVIAGFDNRLAEIKRQLEEQAAILGADLRLEERSDLLAEVTALVEYPTVYVGEFEREFLEVPQECLILTMQQNQKYFPLFDTAGKLRNKFLIVSNMRLEAPENIVEGNQRVIRPRLADARFFYQQDKKMPLAERVPQLAKVVYHNKLGSQLERVKRIEKLAGQLAKFLSSEGMTVEEEKAARAAFLSKADLTTNMVGEFPELQGVMGAYYARHDGEDEQVAGAIKQHYYPRFAGDILPATLIGACVALADRLDALVGIFGIGLPPTGDKDPFGLRRQALGILRILAEKKLPLDLKALLDAAADGSNGLLGENAAQDAYLFMLERLKNYLRDEKGFETEIVDAVVSQTPTRIDLVLPRLEAVRAFRDLPEAASLSIANKRTRNILKKADGVSGDCSVTLFADIAERQLHASIQELAPEVSRRVALRDYTGALKQLAGIRGDVDKFFDDVMVMADDPAIRGNRLALLAELEKLMNQVADISKLAA